VHVVTWSDNAEEDLEDLATAAEGFGLFTLESRVRDITDEEFRAFQQADPSFSAQLDNGKNLLKVSDLTPLFDIGYIV
jgi:hypothetical protein